jgi:acylpyruvate hydrolase
MDQGAPKMTNSSIGSIWAVGRNYAAHARELKNDIPSEPLIFLKSGGCAVEAEKIPLTRFSQDVQHEIEIAVQFGQGLTGLTPVAMRLALDLTARDLQNKAKAAAHPWTSAKSFTAACPLGPSTPFCGFKDFDTIQFELKVASEVRQTGSAADQIFKLGALVEYVLARFPVRPGDLLLTGTPAGVAPLKIGDSAVATWECNGKALPAVHWEFV